MFLTYAAIVRRHQQLRNFSGVDTETMQQRSAVEVPQADGEVHASRDQVRLVIPGVSQTGTEQGIHSSTVTVQDLMRWPF